MDGPGAESSTIKIFLIAMRPSHERNGIGIRSADSIAALG